MNLEMEGDTDALAAAVEALGGAGARRRMKSFEFWP